MSPTLSVIVPCLNSRTYIRSAIEPFREFADVEVLVQDGGSSDGTLEILAEESSQNTALSVVSEADSGQSNALNRALQRVTGEFVLWLNADDLVYADQLRRILSVLPDSDADVVYGDFRIVDADGRVIRDYVSSRWAHERFLRNGCYIFSGAVLWRHDLMERLRYNESLRYTMDLDLFLRAGEPRALKVDGIVAGFRFHGASKSGGEAYKFAGEAYRLRLERARTPSDRLLAVWVWAKSVAVIATTPLRMSRAYGYVRRKKTM